MTVKDQTFVSWKSTVESCLPEQKLHQLASPLRAWMLPSLWRTWGFSIFSLQRLVMIDVVFMSMTGVGMFKYLIKDCYFFAYGIFMYKWLSGSSTWSQNMQINQRLLLTSYIFNRSPVSTFPNDPEAGFVDRIHMLLFRSATMMILKL